MTTRLASAITLKKPQTWFWGIPGGQTFIHSTAEGDVDGDGKTEIVTGGTWLDWSERHNAQLCVWDATTLALEQPPQSWRHPGWVSESWIESVAIGDVDGDGKNEIVTGGSYAEDTYAGYGHAQLCVWDGATLALEKTIDWQEPGNDTNIKSVAIKDVDGDGKNEIVTGGNIRDRAPTPDRTYSQLCVWDGATLALENEFTVWILVNWWINSVAVGDVNGDFKYEIVTGGYFEWYGEKVASLWVYEGATLKPIKYQEWSWSETSTVINSVALTNVDGDFKLEIVTGGWYNDGTRDVAQLCVWNGAQAGNRLALIKVVPWSTYGMNTRIESVAVADVDGDWNLEIVTGGFYANVAQLCVWNTATLALKGFPVTWSWSGGSGIDCVAVGDVDSDWKAEMVTGGWWYNSDEYEFWTQLCVWDW